MKTAASVPKPSERPEHEEREPEHDGHRREHGERGPAPQAECGARERVGDGDDRDGAGDRGGPSDPER